MTYRLIHLDYVHHIQSPWLEIVGEWAVYDDAAEIPEDLATLAMTACGGLLAKWRVYYAGIAYTPDPKPIPAPYEPEEEPMS